MKGLTHIAVLVALCIWHDCRADSKVQQGVYNYKSSVTIHNEDSDDAIGRWTVAGTLTSQQLGKKLVLKFNDIKTSIYNGPKENPKNVEEKSIPENMMVLQEPFVLNYISSEDIKISVLSDEPMWAVNMKRATASIFVTQFTDNTVTEHSIYGDCKVAYDTKTTGNTIHITKTISYDDCTDDYYSGWSNVAFASVKSGYKPLHRSTVRTYNVARDTKMIRHIESSANITHRSMPSSKSGHHMHQVQIFELVETIKAPAFDVSKNTVEKNLHYESPPDKKDEERTPIDILEEFENSYKEFKTQFTTVPLENHNIRNNKTIDDMYNLLSEMNEPTIDLLSLGIFLQKDSTLTHVFLSLIPYVGTNHSVGFIKDVVEADALNDLIIIKMLATFPDYVNDVTEKLIASLEVLMNLKQAENKQVKYAGILSFARLVGIAKDTMNNQTRSNYIYKYYKKFSGSEEHEERMTYLLGLMNMDANKMIHSIIMNADESTHIRALAIYAYTKTLPSDTNELFLDFWPMVTNSSLPFEIRVAALDTCLSMDLEEEQFNEIVNYYDDHNFDDVHDQHLSNYVFTTVQSLQNNTGYKLHMADYATTRLMQGNMPRYQTAWPTGNYRVAYTDAAANYGASLQTRLVANPVSNAIDVVRLTYDNFELSLNMGVYTAYIKLHGAIDYTFINAFLNDRPNDEVPVQALVDLITKFKYNFKDIDDLHIEVVVICNGVALFGIHINQDNFQSYSENPLFLSLVKLIVDYSTVSMPVLDYTNYVSDFGTLVTVSNNMDTYTSSAIENFEKIFEDGEINTFKYRSYWTLETTLETHNPLLNTSINTYHFFSDHKIIQIPFTYNDTTDILSWENKDDAFNCALDRLIGIHVDNDEELHKYCAECDQYNEIPTGDFRQQELSLDNLGIQLKINGTNAKDENLIGEVNFLNYINSHRSNVFSFPLAAPMLYVWHFIAYFQYMINPLNSLLVRTAVLYDEPYMTELDINMDGDTIYNVNDPIDGTTLEFSAAITSKTIKDKLLLNYCNATFKYSTGTKSIVGEAQPHIEVKYDFVFDSKTDKGNRSNTHKVCVNHATLYPSRRADKLSLKPIKPAKGKSTIAWGFVDAASDNCPTTYNIKVVDTLTTSADQLSDTENSNEFKKCNQDSLGLKYVPPTVDCIAAHNAISKYSDYKLYADFKNAGRLAKLHTMLPTDQDGIQLLQYNHIDDGRINVTISYDFVKAFLTNADRNLVAFEGTSAFVDLTADPTSVAYHDDDVVIGLSRKCEITPHDIRTFTGRNFSMFEKEPDKEIVAFVECFNETRSGLTVQRINDKKVGFKFWSGDNLVVATVVGDKMKVTLNGEERRKTDENKEHFVKIYFLDDDVIYVLDNMIEIYYNTEYVSIKSLSILDNYICGECGYYADP